MTLKPSTARFKSLSAYQYLITTNSVSGPLSLGLKALCRGVLM